MHIVYTVIVIALLVLLFLGIRRWWLRRNVSSAEYTQSCAELQAGSEIPTCRPIPEHPNRKFTAVGAPHKPSGKSYRAWLVAQTPETLLQERDRVRGNMRRPNMAYDKWCAWTPYYDAVHAEILRRMGGNTKR